MKKVATLRLGGQVVNETREEPLPMANLPAGGYAVGEGFSIVWRDKSNASMTGAMVPCVLEAVGHRIRFLLDCMDSDQTIEIIKQSYTQALTLVQSATARLECPDYSWPARPEDVADPEDELRAKLKHCRDLAGAMQNRLPEDKKERVHVYAVIAGAIDNIVYMLQYLKPEKEEPTKKQTASEVGASRELKMWGEIVERYEKEKKGE